LSRRFIEYLIHFKKCHLSDGRIASYLLQTWMSVSNENNTSESRRWWMYDHLNSGIRNGGLVGPGLNIGRDELCTT
jgi:hypothetical protein